MRITLLGTGTSTGVPMIGCECKTCRSEDPRDKRLRASALIEHKGKAIVIDTSADFRQQMLTQKLKRLDAVLYTHHHYDHIAGFDDLRAFQFLMHKAPRCYALAETADHIRQTFPYAFGHAIQSGGGLPNVTFQIIGDRPITIESLEVVPIPVKHGMLAILGFRVGNFAYLTDCNMIPESSVRLLKGVDTLVLDGLRYTPHSTHFSIGEAQEEARRIAPRITYLTHMNHDVRHAEAEKKLPENIRLAYDGLTFEL